MGVDRGRRPSGARGGSRPKKRTPTCGEVLPHGWNGDGSHKEDVGERAARYTDAQLAEMQLARAGMLPNDACKVEIFPPHRQRAS